MLHALLTAALAGKTVTLVAQEVRLSSVEVTPAGIDLGGEVRDVCSWHIQNFIWYDGIGEAEAPCSDWRPLTQDDPSRRLVVQTSRELPLRGPVRADDARSFALGVQVPVRLRGSQVQVHFADDRLIATAADLGATLVVADFREVPADRLALGLEGEVTGTEGVPVRFQDPPRTVPVDVLKLSFDLEDEAAEAWRCAALQEVAPEEYQQLSGDRGALVGYAAATCEEAALVQAPPLCEAAATELADADLDGGARVREDVRPVLGICGPSWRNAAKEHAAAEYERALGRGALDDGLRVVETWSEEMGAEWSEQARTQLDELVREQIPSRFDWALHNGATDQARELFESYGAALGEEWSEQASARLSAAGG